jgi:glycolate oxidase
VLGGVRQLSEEFGLPVANVFHAGDGNLHPLILYDANNEGELEKTEELGSKILQLCIHHGGTITGEHGVGVEKLGEMCVQFSETEREQKQFQRWHAAPSSTRCMCTRGSCRFRSWTAFNELN